MRAWGEDIGEPSAGRLRQLLLALVLLGAGGLLTELILLEHYEDVWQWVPLLLLGATALLSALLFVRPGRRLIGIFRGVMVTCVVAGAIGLWLHLQGNYEWELEQGDGLVGAALWWEVLRGATPTLAPGALAQLGLLGLLWTYGHPAARRESTLRAGGAGPRSASGRGDDDQPERG
jgi:hypothetical protein